MHKNGLGTGRGLLEHLKSKNVFILDISFCRAKIIFKNIGDQMALRIRILL